MSRRILGLDIRQDAVVGVLISSSTKGVHIDRCSLVELAETEGTERPLATALKKITAELDLSETVCITAYPPHRTSFRNLQIPFREPKKIKQILPFELEPMLPFPVENLEIDFQVLTPSDAAGPTRVLAVSVDKTDLAEFKGDLKAGGVDPQTITVRGYALAASISRMPDAPDHFMVVDTDGPHTTLMAVGNSQIGMVRSVRTGQRDALQDKLKRLQAAVGEVLDVDFSPGKLFLAGDAVADSEQTAALGTALSIPVEAVDFIKGGVSHVDEASNGWRSGKMDHALALALHHTTGAGGINFSRRSFAVVKQWMAYKKYAFPTMALAAAVLVFGLGGMILDRHLLSRQVAEMDRQIRAVFTSAFPTVTRIVDPLQQMRGELKELRGKAMLDGDNTRTVGAIDILDDISKRIPKTIDADFSQLVIGLDSVMISGSTATFNMVDDMKNNLMESETFKKVTISSANSDRSGKRVTFKLKVEI
jgi:general secretion pathway protein L